MGLDSVELILAIEERFGLELRQEEIERVRTVGELHNLLCEKLKTQPAERCAGLKAFHRVRRALISNYGIQRQQIRPDTKLLDLVEENELEQGWPYMVAAMRLKPPRIKISPYWPIRESVPRQVTVRHVVDSVLALNARELEAMPGSPEHVWAELVDIIRIQLGVKTIEVQKQARLVEDLGLD